MKIDIVCNTFDFLNFCIRYIPNAEMVLIVVIVTDRFRSPPNNLHQKFEALPPGQQPITNNPSRNNASSNSK